jgi:hypothetical protein
MGLAEQGRNMLPLERERGSLGIVFVIAASRTRLDDPRELSPEPGQPLEDACPLRRQQLSYAPLLRHPSCIPGTTGIITGVGSAVFWLCGAAGTGVGLRGQQVAGKRGGLVASVPLAPPPMTAITGPRPTAGSYEVFTTRRIVYNVARINRLARRPCDRGCDDRYAVAG